MPCCRCSLCCLPSLHQSVPRGLGVPLPGSKAVLGMVIKCSKIRSHAGFSHHDSHEMSHRSVGRSRFDSAARAQLRTLSSPRISQLPTASAGISEPSRLTGNVLVDDGVSVSAGMGLAQ